MQKSTNLMKHLSELLISQPISFTKQVAIRAPQQLASRCQLHNLPYHFLLPIRAKHWKHLAEIEVHVLKDCGEISGLSCVWVSRMQQYKCHRRVSFDQRLKVGRI